MVGVMSTRFNELLEEKRVFAECKKAIINPSFKSEGSKLDYGNFRGISLISEQSKLFMRVLPNKIKPKKEEHQAGFREERSTIDQIFVLRQIVEKK